MEDRTYTEFAALDPLFKMFDDAFGDVVDGEHFFEQFSEDAVWENPFPVPGTKPAFHGSSELMAAFRGYGDVLRLESMSDLQIHRCKKNDDVDVIVLEYQGHGQAVLTGKPYDNSYVSIIHIKNRKIFLWRDYADQMIAIEAVGGLEPIIAMLGTKDDR